MARRDEGGGAPIFWLLLGFLCGVVGTLGALLLLSGETAAPSGAPEAVEIGEPQAEGLAPQPPPQIPAPQSAAPPQPGVAPVRQAAPPPNNDAQIAEDAAASGMTARRR